ncbi:hypothetical protein [Dactylosporangium sp. NPDC005555]|uniref:hypothetical protein n=1 Tax=Dactylosporangium sp. NPDC005555 TaxID=3154889 RepID=UPI0033B336FD
MSRTARTFAFAAGLAACRAQQPSTAPNSTVQDNAPPASAGAKGPHVVASSWHVTGTYPAPAAGELSYTA